MTCWLTVFDTLGNAQALVDTLADTVAEVEALTSGDTLRDAHALNYQLGYSWRHTRQCAGTGRHVD